MALPMRDAVLAVLDGSRHKKVDIEKIANGVRRLPVGHLSDFEFQERLLETLQALAGEGRLRLPRARHLWNVPNGLPKHVTAVRVEEDRKQQTHRQTLAALRNETAWEPTRMVAFAHTLRTRTELQRAVHVNRYLRDRAPEPLRVPHRERALRVFGDEKALDPFVRSGLFGGRITLDDLDCFYCPEPLPFHPLSLDSRETAGKPLLVVENANTYWSCCRANEARHRYAAIVYGQGFAACAAERASEGLQAIRLQVAAGGVRYFGDLDPAGIAIPCRINHYRDEKKLPPLVADQRLYQALLEKNLPVPYSGAPISDRDKDRARRWLGRELAGIYLDRADAVRWPQ
ncbi:MAG TPA: hypothetical protein VLT88_01360, partial [Desulfosarcina sp.]|nr:hypothetical protein [Desulfosarcina sp.]